MRGLGTYFLYGLIGLIAIAGATLTMLPATLAARIIGAASEGRMTLGNVSGTAWEGRGDATFAAPQRGQPPITIRNIDWSVRKGRFLVGELALDLKFNGPEINGTAELARGFSYITLRNVRAAFPAAFVAAHVPAARSWNSPGTVDVKSESFTMTARTVEGAAEVLWQGAEATGIGMLGDYRALLKGNGQGPAKVDLTTVRGQLRLDGRGEFTLTSGIRMGVTIDVQGPNREQLLPLLGFIGKQRADGSVAVEIDSRQTVRPAGMKQSFVNGVADHGYQPLST
jgi:hypothetical protein